MKLDSRKKSRRDTMMHEKNFEMQEVTDRLEESSRVESLSNLMDGNNGRCLPDGRKGMQRPGMIESVGKNLCQSEEGALAWDSHLCLGQWQWTRRGVWHPQEIQRGRRGSKSTSETPQDTQLGRAQKGCL